MGYPIDLCCLPEDQKEELKCCLCLDILENPITLVPCGHSFCKEHIDTKYSQDSEFSCRLKDIFKFCVELEKNEAQ